MARLPGASKIASTLGRVQAKTGALSHVNALSGYLTTLEGDRLAFSIIVNNHLLNSHKASETIDDIVTAVSGRPSQDAERHRIAVPPLT